MMINSSLLTFALALLADSSVHSANLGLPASGINDETANQGSFSLMTDEDVAKPDDFSRRRFPFIEVRLAGEDGTKRIFILSDLGSKGLSGSDASSGFGRGFPVPSPWRTDRALALTQKDEWHNEDDLIPVAKRNKDNKMLQCMIGRVYRPCWQA